MHRSLLACTLSVILIFLPYQVYAANAEIFRVAVASNFTNTLKKLQADFNRQSGLSFSISQASTGKLYAQIVHGAPYDMFFSADEKSADLLKKNGLASDSFVYAQGQLVFIASEKHRVSCRKPLAKAISEYAADKIAIANPKVAPYGRAAKQTLQGLGIWQSVKSQLVMGENILQPYQYMLSGSVRSGFIAKSLLTQQSGDKYCVWDIPQNMYQPVRQKVAVMKTKVMKPAVKAFVNYIKSAAAIKIIKNNGYSVPQ